MPIWSEILRELSKTAETGSAPDFDGVRRKYLAALQHHTGRNVVLYASGWLQKDAPPALTSINDEDIHALMEVTWGLHDKNLDLILHSPGGSPEAAEGIVSIDCPFPKTVNGAIQFLVPVFQLDYSCRE